MNHLDPDQVEQVKEIGAYLRQRRQDLSMSIEEVSAKTLIRAGVLKALEAGQLDQLPEPIFVQGFIRRYGDVLHLDGIALAKTFSPSISPLKTVTPIEETPAPSLSVLRLDIVYIALSVIAVCGLIYWLFNKPRTAEPVLRRQNPIEVPQQKTVPQPPPKPAPSVPAPPKASP